MSIFRGQQRFYLMFLLAAAKSALSILTVKCGVLLTLISSVIRKLTTPSTSHGAQQHSHRQRWQKCADTIGTVLVPRGWPFPMLQCSHILQVTYMEAILSNSTRKLLWSADCRGKKYTCRVICYNFRHTFVSYAHSAVHLMQIHRHTVVMVNWVVVLRPTPHKKGHFGDISPRKSLALVRKKLHKSKEMYYNTK